MAITFTSCPAGISTSAVAVRLWVAPAKLIRTEPNRLAGMPTETRPVDPTMSWRLKVSVDSAWRRALKAPNTTPEPRRPATTPTKGKEPEEQGRGGHAGDVEAQVDGAEQAAEDVVDDQGEQEHSASDEEAGAEDEVGGVQALTTSDCSLGRALARCFRVRQGRGANR